MDSHVVVQRWLVFSLCLLGLSGLAPGATTIQGAQGLVLSVDPNGTYDIQLTQPAWHFGGGVGHPLSNIAVVSGLDGVGPYSEIGFDFTAAVVRHAAIRTYANRTAVLFTLSYPNGGTSFNFPSLSQYPANLNHLAFTGTFAPPTFTSLPEESPWAFFDSSANTFILSPASNFMVANLSKTPSGTLLSGFSWQIATVPQGMSHSTLLVVDTGINRAFSTWGNMLTALQGKIRPANDSDTSLNRLGYWTDNGATYYYHMEGRMTYVDTLSAAKAEFDKHGVGLGYLQLDSWFYPKGPQAQWSDSADGFYQYSADSSLFGSSLSNFQQSLGIPLVTHARWIDASSPYRQQYAVSGNVSTDPAYWSMVASYLKNAGVSTYEQDWLSGPAVPSFNLADPEAFLGGMAYAMSEAGLTMQYCMPTTRHVMQSSKYGNLTSIRGANDRFNPDKWTPFLYSTRQIGSVGAFPFADVLMSSETSNLLLSTLSAGPVGLGDQIGTLNFDNILRAVRPDGVIVKPDVPIAPIDSVMLADAASPATAPMVASTYTDFGGLRAHYLFAYPQTAGNTQFTFSLADLGSAAPAYVFDYFNNTGRVVQPADLVSETITGASLYLVAAPIGRSGIAVIGDAGQFVTLGKKRIPSLTDDGVVHVTVAFAPGESSRILIGYSPATAPVVTASKGTADRVIYDAATGRFAVAIQPGADATAVIQINRTFGADAGSPIHPPSRPRSR
ncbi:MAG TPA: hypothetical protein VG456_14985 [Candidatus Sulfopaludibacter sp.]|nr:hypothetical protein [Candidatus Sulfopaludibacter sp.]